MSPDQPDRDEEQFDDEDDGIDGVPSESVPVPEEFRPSRGFDYRASREHWDKVFAERWVQEWRSRHGMTVESPGTRA